MTHVQIFRDLATNRPLWAVVHNSPTGDDTAAMEARTDIVDSLAAVLEKVGGEKTAVLSAADITVEVL